MVSVLRRLATDCITNRRLSPDRQTILFPMLNGVDVALRYETLEKGLNYLLSLVGADSEIRLPKKNVTPGKKDYVTYYSRLSRTYVQVVFRKELQAFGYACGKHSISGPLIWLDESAREKIGSVGT